MQPRGTGGTIQEGPNETIEEELNESTPRDSFVTDESMEQAIDIKESLLTGQLPTPKLDLGISLPAHVKLLHWVLLAQGSRRPRLQLITTYGPGIAWVVLFTALKALDWHTNHQLDSVKALVLFGNFVFVLEATVNALFCYEFSQNNQLQRLVTWVTAHQSGNIPSPVESLNKVAWGGWAAYLFFVGLNTWVVMFNTCKASMWGMAGMAGLESGSGVAITLVQVVLLPFLWALMIYLCLLWLWMNWVIHTAAQCWVQHRLDADGVLGVGGRDAGKELWEILAQMKEVSSIWAKNHLVRFVTTTVFATTLQVDAESALSGCGNDTVIDAELLKAYQLTIAATLYMFVWVTAAVPGYVTDMLFSNLHRKLYTMWPEDTNEQVPPMTSPTSVLPVLTPLQQPQQLQQPHSLATLEAKATGLMHRAHYLQGREGMHFAFVPMSLARAITVGTVLGYTIAYTTRISE
jgi:hypothetical protein